MKDRSLIYALALIIIVIAIAFMLKGLAKAPVWLIVLLILAVYFVYRYRKGNKLP